LDGYANELDAGDAGSNLGKLIDANCCTWMYLVCANA
jgi:hypothetical protein